MRSFAVAQMRSARASHAPLSAHLMILASFGVFAGVLELEMFQYCAIVVLLLAAFPSIESQCTSDPDDPCSATCNGTRISISALQYP